MRLFLHDETGRRSARRLVCIISLSAPALISLSAEQTCRHMTFPRFQSSR